MVLLFELDGYENVTGAKLAMSVPDYACVWNRVYQWKTCVFTEDMRREFSTEHARTCLACGQTRERKHTCGVLVIYYNYQIIS